MASDNFEIRVVKTFEEFREVVDVVWEGILNPYTTIFPTRHIITGYTEEDYQHSKELDAIRMWNVHRSNKASTWIMAIDLSTSRVAGVVEWLFWHENPFPNGPKVITSPWLPEGSEAAEYASRLVTSIFRPRGLWCQRAHAGVNSTIVLPNYRRRGIGTLLMDWGLKKVDELGYECFIEGSELGQYLYQSVGFRTLLIQNIDMSKPNPSPMWRRMMHEWAPRPVALLWRPKKGVWEDDGPQGPWDVGK